MDFSATSSSSQTRRTYSRLSLKHSHVIEGINLINGKSLFISPSLTCRATEINTNQWMDGAPQSTNDGQIIQYSHTYLLFCLVSIKCTGQRPRANDRTLNIHGE